MKKTDFDHSRVTREGDRRLLRPRWRKQDTPALPFERTRPGGSPKTLNLPVSLHSKHKAVAPQKKPDPTNTFQCFIGGGAEKMEEGGEGVEVRKKDGEGGGSEGGRRGEKEEKRGRGGGEDREKTEEKRYAEEGDGRHEKRRSALWGH